MATTRTYNDGGTTVSIYNDNIYYGTFVAAASETIGSVGFHANSIDYNCDVKLSIWDSAGTSKLAEASFSVTPNASPAWYTDTLDAPVDLTSSTTYMFCVFINGSTSPGCVCLGSGAGGNYMARSWASGWPAAITSSGSINKVGVETISLDSSLILPITVLGNGIFRGCFRGA